MRVALPLMESGATVLRNWTVHTSHQGGDPAARRREGGGSEKRRLPSAAGTLRAAARKRHGVGSLLMSQGRQRGHPGKGPQQPSGARGPAAMTVTMGFTHEEESTALPSHASL